MAYFNRGNESRGNRNFGKPRFGNDRPELYKATCANCGKACEVPFKPSGSKPVLCRDCFKNNDRSDSRGFENKSSRQMYDAVCSNCGNNCKIPFRPTEGREVLCSNCFEKNGPIDTRKPFEKQNFNRNDRPQRANEVPNYQAQFDALNAKMDKILDILHSAMTEVSSAESPVDEVAQETASNPSAGSGQGAVEEKVLEATSDVAEEKTEEEKVEKIAKTPKKTASPASNAAKAKKK